MSVNQPARALAADATRLNEIVRGWRGITADTAPGRPAQRPPRYSSESFWITQVGGGPSCTTTL